MCADTVGTARLCGVSRVTIWLWRKDKLLSGIRIGGKTFIPLRDIAEKMNTTQKRLIEIADDENIPLWRVKP